MGFKIHKVYKAAEQKPSVWCNNNWSLLSLVMDECVLQEVLSHDGPWAHIEAHLFTLVNSSTIASRLFSPSTAQVLAELVQGKVQAAIEQLCGAAEITAAALQAAEQAVFKDISTVNGIDMSPDRRPVKLH